MIKQKRKRIYKLPWFGLSNEVEGVGSKNLGEVVVIAVVERRGKRQTTQNVIKLRSSFRKVMKSSFDQRLYPIHSDKFKP